MIDHVVDDVDRRRPPRGDVFVAVLRPDGNAGPRA
jgi:hypothetical protein